MAIQVAPGAHCLGSDITVHISVPFDRLHELRHASTALGSAGELSLCSDGIDNDGDGAVDLADAGCRLGNAHSEYADNDEPASLSWTWGKASDGDFLHELLWTNPETGQTVPVVSDEPTTRGMGCRWWPHGGNCSHWHQSCVNPTHVLYVRVGTHCRDCVCVCVCVCVSHVPVFCVIRSIISIIILVLLL